MAATPYKADLVLAFADGTPFRTLAVSADDVAGNKVTFDDLDDDSFYIVPEDARRHGGGIIVSDIKSSADGVDTKRLEFQADGRNVQKTLRIKPMSDGGSKRGDRVPIPLGFKVGRRVTIVQRA